MPESPPIRLTFDQSKRLALALLTKTDLEEVRELHNHPQVLKELTDIRPVNSLEQEKWYQAISSSKSSYRIVARMLSTHQLIGVFRIDNFDAINQSAQVGLDVHPIHQRKGFGREIYTIMLNQLFGDWNLYRIYLETLSSNFPARQLYDSLGFKEEGIGREAIFRSGSRKDLVYYGLLRSEWHMNQERYY